MKSQVVIEFGLTFFIVFSLIVILMFMTMSKIDSIQKMNTQDYALVNCYHASDYIVTELSTNQNQVDLSKVKSYVDSKGYFVTFTNEFGTRSYGKYISGTRVSVRRLVILNSTFTYMDLVCSQ